MGVEGRLDVAKNLVVDSLGARDCQHGIAEPSHVVEEMPAREAHDRVQIEHDGIGQQQAVARENLRVAQDGELRSRLAVAADARSNEFDAARAQRRIEAIYAMVCGR